MEEKIYDLIIIGAGPAGLTASIYAQRAGLNTLVLEKLSPGGQILFSEKIENYPGFSQPISPQKLMEEMQKQAENLGMRLEQGEVEKIGIENNKKIVYTESGEKYKALSLIIASGCNQRKLGVQGEEKFIGRGVSYCATCDAPFFKEKKVVVVGGSNTAAEEALYLTKFVDKVYLIHRRGMLRAEKILQERISKNPKIEIVWKSVIERIYGEKEVKGVKIKNVDTEEIKDLSCSGVFIFIGLEPNTHFLRNMVKLDEIGFVNTNNNLQTDKKGIFACGDVRKNTLKQVIVACGEGALAAYSAQKYINNIKGIEYN